MVRTAKTPQDPPSQTEGRAPAEGEPYMVRTPWNGRVRRMFGIAVSLVWWWQTLLAKEFRGGRREPARG